MKTRRLWPLTTTLVAILFGAASLELMARYRPISASRVPITDNQAVVEREVELAGVGAFGPAIDGEHERARKLSARNELPEALATLDAVIRTHPSSPELAAERAHYLLGLERANEALTALEALPAKLAAAPIVRLDWAHALEELGRHGDAIELLRRSVRENSSHSGLRVALADLLRGQGSHDEAISVLLPAASSGSNAERARALALLGRCYVLSGQKGKAEAVLTKAIEFAPASVAIWTRVARAYLESPEPAWTARALTHAENAAKLGPNISSVHGLVGRIAEKLERASEAQSAYTRAAELDPDYLFARKRLLRMGLANEDFRLARQQAQAILRIDPARPEHSFLAGLVESRSGHTDRAREYYQAAIESAGQAYAEAWYNLGLLEREAGRVDAAKQAYTKALELNPGYLAAHNNLGLVLLDENDVEGAKASFRRAIERDRNYGPAWTNLARTLSQAGEMAAAAHAYREASRLAPDERGLRVQLAIALRKAGRANEAIELYRVLLAREPRFVNGWYNLGIALETSGRADEARAAYQRASDLDPHHASAVKNLALLETRLGRWEEARLHLFDALDQNPSDAELRLALARTLLASNDKLGCSHAARLALIQAPDSSQARELSERCSR